MHQRALLDRSGASGLVALLLSALIAGCQGPPPQDDGADAQPVAEALDVEAATAAVVPATLAAELPPPGGRADIDSVPAVSGLTALGRNAQGLPEYDLLLDGSAERLTLRLVLLPAGAYLMGAPPQESGGPDEGPVRELRVGAFLLASTEVTEAQWAAVMGARSERPGVADPQLPVAGVTFAEAQAFCRRTGLRLPSEAEWEYAAREGRNSRWDPADLDRQAWFSANADDRRRPVSQKAPNAFGLHDLLGNLDEWCEDAWHPGYDGAPADASARSGPPHSSRVLRGGSFISGPGNCRPAFRTGAYPDLRLATTGFRPARSP